VTTGSFRDFFVSYVTSQLSTGKSDDVDSASIVRTIQSLDWETLFLSKGMPTYKIDFTNTLSEGVQSVLDRWIGVRRENLEITEEITSSLPDMQVSVGCCCYYYYICILSFIYYIYLYM
jgi:hypothetical protein